MKREIKKLGQLKIQANYIRLARVEQAIIDALIKNHEVAKVNANLCNDFVEGKLKQSEYSFFVADEPLTGVNRFEKLIIKLK